MKRVFAVALVATCAYAPTALAESEPLPGSIPFERDGSRQMSAYKYALQDRYFDLAENRDLIGDTDEDRGYFLDKSELSREGYLVYPDTMNSRDIDVLFSERLEQARARVMDLVYSDAPDLAPTHVAAAQVSFDCWMMQSEIGFPDGIDRTCEERFLNDVASAERKVAEERELTMATDEPRGDAARASAAQVEQPRQRTESSTAAEQRGAKEDTLLFAFDSAEIDPVADEHLENVAAFLRDHPYEEVRVIGHADRAGPADYNVDLSRERAMAVRDRLVSNGAEDSKVRVVARGESDPVLELGDGVRAKANRRVEVIVEAPYVVSSNQ